MAFHVRDPETDRLVRKLAESRGVGITDAVREAVSEALEQAQPSRWERTASLRAEVASWPITGELADKAFFDDLSGHESDQ